MADIEQQAQFEDQFRSTADLSKWEGGYRSEYTQGLWAGWQAALASQEGVPEGWVLVPREATEEMYSAAAERVKKNSVNWNGGTLVRDPVAHTWAAMLSAAPVISDAVVSAWQSIETAPKDGTGILMSNGVDVAHGHWFFDEGGTIEYRDADGFYIDQDDQDGYEGWIDWNGGMIPPPTHWMPLPEPPGADDV